MIKPFNRVRLPPSKGKIVTVPYLRKALQAVLGRWNVTIEGGDLQQTGDGHLHVRLTAAKENDDPFKVTANNGVISVAPGLVYSTQFTTANGWIVPVIGDRFLNATPPPSLFFNGAAGFVCLVAEFDVNGAALNLPWKVEIFAGSPPQDVGLVRLNSFGTPAPGKYHVLIASIVNGVVHQWVKRNILINLQWEQPFIWA